MKDVSRFQSHRYFLSFVASCCLLASVSDAAQPGIPIAGRVLDTGGEPFAGATVTLAVEASEYEATKLVLAGHSRPEPLFTVASDEQGWFSLEAPEAGLWRVTVEARGHVSMRNRLLPLVDVAVLPAVRLTPATTHTVTIREGQGDAVVGAQVWAAGDQRWLASRRDGWSPTGRFVLSDAQGKAVLARAADEALQVYAYAPGFAVPERQRAAVAASKATSEIVLEDGVSFDILFQSPQGEPLEGSVVRLGSGGASAGLLGSEGRFRLTLVPDRALLFDVTTPDGQQQGGTFNLSAEALKEIEAGEPQVMKLPEPIVVEGRVVEESTRRPVPGALVWNPNEARFAVRTDRRGHYRMTLREASRIALQAVAVGYAETGTEVLAEGPGSTDAPTLVLRPAGSVIGRVVDGEGQPVAGATVQVRPDDGRDFTAYGRNATPRARSVSLPDGRFYFATLPPKVDWQVTVRAQGFAEARRAVRSGGEIEIVLAAPHKARGRVVDQAGAPIVGARALIIPVPADQDLTSGSYDHELWMRDPTSFPQGESNPEGVFEISGLASGPVVLGVQAEGFAPTIRDSVHIGDEAITDLGTVRLQPAVSLTGIVVDSDDRPIEGARIHWYLNHHGAVGASRMNGILHASDRQWHTDAAGRFEVGPMASEMPVNLSASAEGFVNQEAYGVAASADSPGSAEAPVRIVMKRGATLSGVVVDRRGSPVANARLRVGRSARPSRFGRANSQWGGRTDAEGSFEISKLAPGTLNLHAQSKAHGTARIEGIELRSGERLGDLRLVLDPRVILSGQITDRQGRVVEGASVFAFEQGRADALAGHASDRSDGDGRYRLVLEKPATFRVSVQHPDLLRLEEPLTLEAGEHRHDFVLQSGYSIRGEVIDGDNVPATGARVTIGGSGQHYVEPRSVRTDESGHFQVDGVDNGTYYMEAATEDWAPAHLAPLVVDGENIDGVVLRLAGGTVVRGRIEGLEATEREQVRVELMRIGAFALRAAQIQPGGTAYRLEHVGPGSWQILARLPNGRMASEQLEVTEGESERLLDLVFEAGWSVTGQVTLNGAPLAGATVSASSATGSAGSTRTDREGRFRLEGLSSGQVFFNVMSTDGEMVEMRSLELDGDSEVSFALETSILVGRVLTAEGLPLAGVRVLLAQDRQTYFGVAGTAVTAADGAFTLTATHPGAFVLRADYPGYATAEHPIEVVSGVETSALTVVLALAEEPEDP